MRDYIPLIIFIFFCIYIYRSVSEDRCKDVYQKITHDYRSRYNLKYEKLPNQITTTSFFVDGKSSWGSGKRCSRGTDRFQISCAFDNYSPNFYQATKELKISDYKSGLFGSGYFGITENDFVEIYPITSLKAEPFTTEAPSFLSFNGEKINIRTNTFLDDKEVLIRGYASKNSQGIVCYDAVYKKEREIVMSLYYTKDDYLFKKEFNLRKAGL